MTTKQQEIDTLKERIKLLEAQLEDVVEMPHTDDATCWCQPTKDGSMVFHKTALALAHENVGLKRSRDHWRNIAAGLSIKLVVSQLWARRWKKKAKMSKRFLQVNDDLNFRDIKNLVEEGMKPEVVTEGNTFLRSHWRNARAEEAEALVAKLRADLEFIGDIAEDYDGYETPNGLKSLIDEIRTTAYDALGGVHVEFEDIDQAERSLARYKRNRFIGRVIMPMTAAWLLGVIVGLVAESITGDPNALRISSVGFTILGLWFGLEWYHGIIM